MGKVESTKFIERELINGRSADHWKLTSVDGSARGIWDYWEDIRLHICVRAELPNLKAYNVTHLEEGKQPAELFSHNPNLQEIKAPANLPRP